ncbi:MAG: inositol monophosphatase family protein [Acidimicrobiales bacterium]|jgi:myo-inositol-1(or 4)-monophosphatase
MSTQDLPADLLDDLYEVALRVATGAAGLLTSYSTRRLQHVETKSSPTDLVSEADRASEAYIVAELARSRPDDAFQGEEGGSLEGRSGVSWVADPLDGTTNFFFGVPAYSVSLAARVKGRTVVGVVVDPSRAETWSAALGRGAWCNGSKCQVALGRSELSTALVATGFGYGQERRAEQAALLPSVLPAVRDIRRFGSAAIDLCWVAGGRLDAYYESHLNDWDWAAGSLVCEEAGGKISRLEGEILLAATPGLIGPLSELLITARARGARA